VSIRSRLLVFFGLLTATGAAAFLVLWLYGLPTLGVDGMVAQEYSRAIAGVESVADKQRDLVEIWFENHRREIRLLSEDEALAREVAVLRERSASKTPGAQQALIRRLTRLKESNPDSYRSIQLIDPVTGYSLAATADVDIPNEGYETWVAEAREPGMTESVHFFTSGAELRAMVFGQIFHVDDQGNPDGTLLALLAADIQMTTPFEQMEVVLRQALGATGSVLLINRQGRVLLKEPDSQSDEDAKTVAESVVSGTEGVKMVSTAQHVELISVFRYIRLGASDELSIAVTRNTDEALAAIRASFWRMSGLMALICLASVGLVVFAANRIARVEAEIRAVNANLESRIEARTHELAQANQELKSTLENLGRTRDDLVRSEKMAALGSLVAGVAHELNTPVGSSLTVASTMLVQSDAFKQALNQGLKRSTLDIYVANTREGIDILLSSLKRAANLVTSFKQVAVDQTSENFREFDLADTVNEILMTLGPMIRHTPHHALVDIPKGIVMKSYPGPLGQILNNLISNAILHGLHDLPDGHILVSARSVGTDKVEISVSDDGAGIAPEHLKRVFDPFFTTKLGHGGSGLGLNIVYNLVTQTLGGVIRVDSTWGHGAKFILTLPLVVAANS
jgi:signal transduction histidine kinase